MTKKTYKRELAGVMFLWLVYLAETKEIELVSTLAPPIFMYIAFAFGADVYSKLQQSGSRSVAWGRAQRSSEYPTGRDELSNSRDYPSDRTEDSSPQREGY